MIAATMVVATIPVTDLERAKQFYGDVLALTLLSETLPARAIAAGPLARSRSSSGHQSPRSTPWPTSRSTTSRP